MRHLKRLDTQFQITKFNISLCCQIFFANGWSGIRSDMPEYAETMSKLTNNGGIILCPDCLTSHLSIGDKSNE